MALSQTSYRPRCCGSLASEPVSSDQTSRSLYRTDTLQFRSVVVLSDDQILPGELLKKCGSAGGKQSNRGTSNLMRSEADRRTRSSAATVEDVLSQTAESRSQLPFS